MPCLAPPRLDSNQIAPTQVDPLSEVDPLLTPTAGGTCPVCGSSNTHNEEDANGWWVVCHDCHSRSQ